MNLKHITRGDSSLYGKQRVYLIFHPADRRKALDIAAQDILDLYNCAVFYAPEKLDYNDPVQVEELQTELSKMHLFVGVISTNFLISDCGARIVEYGFAIRQQIPMLPILMEPGLDHDFAEAMNDVYAGFGDIQFLDRCKDDPTEIPYRQKLQKRMHMILLGDERMRLIRSIAFDTYVFLSYRKKDRAKGQDLMRRIHGISEFERTAVWYDEFLEAGERWLDAIRAAMNQSEAVILAVTENLMEVPNFISAAEYPMAVEKGKTVLPLLIDQVEYERLETVFRNLPEPVDGTDELAIREALKEILNSSNGRHMNTTPEEQYLTGLAYLNGIDVEQDQERALRLITAAAEEGWTEAIIFLADFYYDGQLTKMDLNRALMWRERLIHHLQEQNVADGEQVFTAYHMYAVQLAEMNRVSEAEHVYRELSSAVTDFLQELPVDQYELAADLCRCMGNLAVAVSCIDETYHWFRVQYDTSMRAYEANSNSASLYEVCVSCSNLSFYAKEQGDYASALEWARKAADGLERLWQSSEFRSLHSKMGDFRYDLCAARDRIGEILEMQCDFAQARICYEESLKSAEEMTEELRTPQAFKQQAVSLWNLGDVDGKEGRTAEQKKYYRAAIDSIERAVRDEATLEHIKMLDSYCKNLGSLLMQEGNTEEAKELIRKALKYSENIAEQTMLADYRLDTGVSHYNLGQIAYEEYKEAQGRGRRQPEKRKEAKEHFRRALDIYENTPIEKKSIKFYKNMAMTCNAIGVMADESGQDLQAMEHYRRANEYQSKVCEEERSAESVLYLGITWENMGIVANSYKDKKKMYLRAEECLKEAYEEACDEQIQNNILEKLVEVYSDLLEIAGKTGDQMLAERLQERWEKLCVAMVADASVEKSADEEITLDVQAGSEDDVEPWLAEIRRYNEAIEELNMTLYDGSPDEEDYMEKLKEYSWKTQPQMVLDLLEKERKILEEQMEEAPSGAVVRELKNCYYQMAFSFEIMEDRMDEADFWFSKAVALDAMPDDVSLSE